MVQLFMFAKRTIAMAIRTASDLTPLIDKLFASDEASALTNEAARALETCRDVIEGISMAAQKIGLGDVMGVLQGSLSEDTSLDADKVRKALEMLSEMGLKIDEPDLDSLLTEPEG
jgi:hypothetical protein